MNRKERKIRQERVLWADSEMGHELMKVIFDDELEPAYLLRWDIYAHTDDDHLVFAASSWVEDPSEIKYLQKEIKDIQYHNSEMVNCVNEAIDKIGDRPKRGRPAKTAA